MDKSNLELFKQAISEGLSDRFDSVVDSCTEEIVCSEKHKLAMRTIVYGKVGTGRTMSPKMRKIIAILVAAALLLTSCAVIFRNEIREMVEDICDFFVAITYTEKGSDGTVIEDVYELGYLPEGYSLNDEVITPVRTQYEFTNDKEDYIWFEQRVLDGSDFTIDSESGYSQIKDIEEYDVYYRFTEKYCHYIWSDCKYSMSIKSKIELSNEQIVRIIDGVKVK